MAPAPFKQVASVQLQKLGQLVPLGRSLVVPGEGSLSSPVVLLATHASYQPCSLRMVSFVGKLWGCSLTADAIVWALCLFEEGSQLLTCFGSFAGVLIIALDDSEHQQKVCYIFPMIRPKSSCQPRHQFLLLGCRSRTEWSLQELSPKPSSAHIFNWDLFTTDLVRKTKKHILLLLPGLVYLPFHPNEWWNPDRKSKASAYHLSQFKQVICNCLPLSSSTC